MFIGSLRLPGLPPPDGADLLPSPLSWQNYRTVTSLIPFWTQLRNSLLVAAVAVPITVVVASLTGFGIVVSDARWRRFLIGVCIAVLLIPAAILWVPRFALFRWLDVVNTPIPLIAPAIMATTPFYVLLYALAYWRLPKNLFEAARVEGESALGIWRRVAWPLGRGTTFAVAVLAFVWHWSNFVDPLLYLSSPGLHTLPLGLRSLSTLEPTKHGLFLAASVLATLPPAAAFLLAHRSLFERTIEA
jgi:multiple sugar transport system permease protein